MNITGRLDNHIHLPWADLPSEVRELIRAGATLENVAKIEAKKFAPREAATMPDFIEMYEIEGDSITLPRGYASHLVDALQDFDIEVEWQDERCHEEGFVGGNEIPARPYQQKVINAVLGIEQGIVTAPTGAGKTVAALDIIRRLHGNALVIVNTKEIAQQWIDRIDQWLGEDYPVGLIGDNEFEISNGITVAIQASLWSKGEKLWDDGFFDRFQTVCLDECHHATAKTYSFVLDSFSAATRFGMSATPKKTGDFRLAEAILGPVIVEVSEDDVKENIMKPKIDVIPTGFSMEFKVWKHRGVKRTNYQTVLKNLTEDQDRNGLIANEIMDRHEGNRNLVLSKRIKHLSAIEDALVQAGYDQEDILWLTGSQSRAERKEVVQIVEERPCVVLSTLADEALDAPRLDRLHITFPTAGDDLVKQQIGRIRRRHPEKADCMVLDYWDKGVRPLNKQYLNRRHEVYDALSFEVIKRKDGR